MSCRWAVLLIAICGLFLGCQRESVKNVASAVPVHVESVSASPLTRKLDVIGTVQASSTVAIIPRVSGQIVKVYFTEGEVVREGQPLVQIDPRPYAAALAEKRALLAKSEAELTKAIKDRQRYESLVRHGYVSREAYEQMATDASVLKATVEANRAQVRMAELNLLYCDIKAPVSGRIGDLRLHKGSMVKDNDSGPITTIDTMRPCRVLFSVPEGYLPALHRRMRDGVLTIEAVPQGSRGEEGIVTLLDNNVDTKTGSIRMRGEFENASGALWPGQFVEVRLPLAEVGDAHVVPCKAIQSGRDGSYVYVVGSEGRAALRPVKQLFEAHGQCAVTGDLTPGEMVVTEGQARVVPGILLDIQQPTRP